MIIENGTYCYEISIGGDVDEYGRPIPAEVEWSGEIPCNIQTLSDNKLASSEDNKYRQSRFLIIVPPQFFPYKRIKLSRHGELLGVFNVVSTEPLEAVGLLKVTLST